MVDELLRLAAVVRVHLLVDAGLVDVRAGHAIRFDVAEADENENHDADDQDRDQDTSRRPEDGGAVIRFDIAVVARPPEHQVDDEKHQRKADDSRRFCLE